MTDYTVKCFNLVEGMFEWGLRKPIELVDVKDKRTRVYRLDEGKLVWMSLVRDGCGKEHFFAHVMTEGMGMVSMEPMLMDYRGLDLKFDGWNESEDRLEVLEDVRTYQVLFGIVYEICAVVDRRWVRGEVYRYEELIYEHGVGSKKSLKLFMKQEVFVDLVNTKMLHAYDYIHPTWCQICRMIKGKLKLW